MLRSDLQRRLEEAVRVIFAKANPDAPDTVRVVVTADITYPGKDGHPYELVLELRPIEEAEDG
ncbi:MAG: hypothetical protein KKC03_13695 [Bacteroidetes bacterium]|nr:hypothetical protein [Bacteroidota bacterium]